MPLTKPECLECDYSLHGIRFGEMCPECGCVERKLLLDGSSKALSACILLSASILMLSVGAICVAFLHTTLMPTFKTEWAVNTSSAIRGVLIPTLFVSAALIAGIGYAVVIASTLNHTLNRIRKIQFAVCLGMSLISVLAAAVWMM
jgi:uncharacterized membrane protein YbhN (UPF0104 family)